MSLDIKNTIGSGVIFGEKIFQLYEIAKENQFAIPAVNVTGTNTINAALETAALVKSPVIIQISQLGSYFYAGYSLSNDEQEASILGAVSAAFHIHTVAKAYDIPVIIHTDNSDKNQIKWLEGIIEHSEKFFNVYKKPLFSSHLLDLSELSIEENIKTCEKYLSRLSKIGSGLEIELGVNCKDNNCEDNIGIDNPYLYTQPEDVAFAYERLLKISNLFTIAPAFGNVHGVYKPGNVFINPVILKNSQSFVQNKFNTSKNPVSFVFHGGSGSMKSEIDEAINYGIVKVNIDTDTQWAFWNGVRKFYISNEAYLKGQIGNPEGEDRPNKKKYDPREWLRHAEDSMVDRLENAYKDLNCISVL